MKTVETSNWHSPIGWLSVSATAQGIVEIACRCEPDPMSTRETGGGGETAEAIKQLQEYFRGERRSFSLRLSYEGHSPFTSDILNRLSAVPFGLRVTYGELAAMAGRPDAARAVGRAMATNPFLIVVPCHRVLGAGGRMTGYSGGSGIATKEWLLDFERKVLGGSAAAHSGNSVKIE